jgi:hypothetical protein
VLNPFPIKSSKYVITISTRKNKNVATNNVIKKGGKKERISSKCNFFTTNKLGSKIEIIWAFECV